MASKAKGNSGDKGVTQCSVGTVLFREGETGKKMYVIKSGRVRMTKIVQDTSVTVEVLGAGDFCGEIALITDQPRPTTATVVADASVIQIDGAQFENMMRSNSDIALRMLKKMSKRLTESQFRVANFTLRTTRGRLMHQLHREASHQEGKAALPDNLADVLGLTIGEVKRLLSELLQDDLIEIDKKGFFQIVDQEGFEQYLKYLELHDRFEYRD